MNIDIAVVDGLGNETIAYENLIKNLFKKCFNEIKLKINKIIFITPNTNYKNSDFHVIHLGPLNYLQYNLMLFSGLNEYCTSDRIMCIQTDGFCFNNNLWDEEYLKYDYIGAPWPSRMPWCNGKNLVGNGGFCIKSKNLYKLTSNINLFSGPNMPYFTTNEDVFISSTIRNYLESNNINFAPVELARKFSVEIPIDDDHTLMNSFGFHGKNYMQENEFLQSYLL